MSVPQHLIDGHKSSYSGEETNCMYVQVVGGEVHVTNTNRPDDAPQRFTFSEWHAAVSGFKAGEFDLDA